MFGNFFNKSNNGDKNFSHINFEEFKKGITEKDSILIDVRTSNEFESGHIKNAKNIDIYSSNFQNELEKLDKEKPYYINCQSGGRSRSAVSQMKKLGFKKVYGLEGGISSWYDPKIRGK
jgi:rhodanese-related sulfurtransferase